MSRVMNIAWERLHADPYDTRLVKVLNIETRIPVATLERMREQAKKDYERERAEQGAQDELEF